MVNHFLSAADLTRNDAEALLNRATDLKNELKTGGHANMPLRGKTLALVFEKPSLRTRVAFEAGMTQLGGHGSYLSANDIDMGGRESVPDVARNLSRWVNVIAARVFRHTTVVELARHSNVPVINALCDREHPCQALADMLTLREHFGGRLHGLKLAYVGDGNNVCHSLMLLGATLGVNVGVACPPDYRPDPEIVAQAEQRAAESDATIA
ncbi:MAG: ornithine carbamoyltransferase, partial [Chloroflexi bacterium SZAS-1]|nr:ornithine carbamoyltransferase [Chloroflexi bacterium SZAS-1]